MVTAILLETLTFKKNAPFTGGGLERDNPVSLEASNRC